MEEKNPYLSGDQKKKRSGGIFIILTILFALLSAFLGWQLKEKGDEITAVEEEQAETITEKDKLAVQLQSIEFQYEELINENEGLEELLGEEKAQVEKLRKELSRSKGSAAAYKKQVEEMKQRLAEYLETIEQLEAQNQELTAENIVMRTRLDSSMQVNKSLTAENIRQKQTIASGKQLEIYDVVSDALKVRNNGNEIPTPRASRVDRIRTCFLLGANDIADAGAKKVYIRIADPEGRILTPSTGDEYAFDFQGNKLQCSVIGDIDYKNDAQDLCFYWDKIDEFPKGKYFVDIYMEGELKGSASFDLK